eukprot:647387-Rhodomonas_salina.1
MVCGVGGTGGWSVVRGCGLRSKALSVSLSLVVVGGVEVRGVGTRDMRCNGAVGDRGGGTWSCFLFKLGAGHGCPELRLPRGWRARAPSSPTHPAYSPLRSTSCTSGQRHYSEPQPLTERNPETRSPEPRNPKRETLSPNPYTP